MYPEENKSEYVHIFNSRNTSITIAMVKPLTRTKTKQINKKKSILFHFASILFF